MKGTGFFNLPGLHEHREAVFFCRVQSMGYTVYSYQKSYIQITQPSPKKQYVGQAYVREP